MEGVQSVEGVKVSDQSRSSYPQVFLAGNQLYEQQMLFRMS